MCFNCFGYMLQVFPLDIIKVDLTLHMLQRAPSAAAAAGVPCMCVRSEGGWSRGATV
jgi:hypothetical protein